MDLCHILVTTVGKLALEQPCEERTYGSRILQILGCKVLHEASKAGVENVFTQECMQESHFWFERATAWGVEPDEEELMKYMQNLRAEVGTVVSMIPGMRMRLQAYALLFLSTYYTSSEWGRAKDDALRAVHRVYLNMIGDPGLMEAITPHLSPYLFLTANQVELCVCFYSIHMELVYLCALSLVPMATEMMRCPGETTKQESRWLAVMTSQMVEYLKLLETYNSISMYSVAKAREPSPGKPDMKPKQNRVDVISAAMTFLRHHVGFQSDKSSYCFE